MFAKVSGSQVLAYPYTRSDLQNDFPRTSFPTTFDAATFAAFGVVDVVATAQPALQLREVAVEGLPVLDGSVWRQTWTVQQVTLAQAKKLKIDGIKADGIDRIRARLGDVVGDLDGLLLVKTIWLSIASAARAPTTDMQWLIDTAQAVQTAVAAVNAATTLAQVRAVAVSWPV